MFTQRHYEAIAGILRQAIADYREPLHKTAVIAIAKRLADWFAEDNANFNRERFYQAVLAESLTDEQWRELEA